MLKLSFITLLIIWSQHSMSQNTDVGVVEFSTEIIPSCYSTMNDNYWQWRDIQKRSENVRQDISLAIENIDLFNIELKNIDLNTLEVKLCNEKFIFSSHLARAMNFYGPNVSPTEIYYNVLNKLTNLDINTVNKNLLIDIIDSGMQEMEKRFEEEDIEIEGSQTNGNN
jgi:hypothetical protein